MITAGELRAMLKGKPDKWRVPISIAYSETCNDYVFVRLDGASVTRPTTPGNIHANTRNAIFITVALVSSED